MKMDPYLTPYLRTGPNRIKIKTQTFPSPWLMPWSRPQVHT